MKSILRLSIMFFLAVTGSVLPAADTAQIDAEMKRIEALTRALDSGGAAGVLAVALPAPLIRSFYYAEKLAEIKPERRVVEQAKREFGFKLAVELDETAALLQKRADSAERVRQAGLLFDLAAWLRTAQGYGNYVLFSRCESLATVPLAYLTADLDYPLDKVAELRRRILPATDERAFRVAVLNDEAPKPFIGPLLGNESEQDEQIQIAWNTRWNDMRTLFKSRELPISQWKRSALPEELKFFLDDEQAPQLLTTVNLWNLKRHNTLIFGHRDTQVRNIDEFMLFREKVGSFPTQPPHWWKPSADNSADTALRAAFQEASKHLRRENGQVFGYSMPAIVYQQVQEGGFMDRETQYINSARPAKAGKPKP